MKILKQIFKQTVTYKLYKEICANLTEFLEQMGRITLCGAEFFKSLFKGEIDKKELIVSSVAFKS